MARGAIQIRSQQISALPSEEYVHKAMPQKLGTFDMTMLFLMIMFFVNNPVGTIGAGAASLTYWAIGGLTFFIPCVIATAQLGSMFPYEGSTYNWTHKALGGFWSLFASVSFWVPGVLGMVAGASIAVTFIQGLNASWLIEPWQQGLVIIAILVFSACLSFQRLHTIRYIVNATMLLTLFVIVLLGLAALVWVLMGHHSATSFTRASDWSVNPSNFSLFGVVTLAYLGADVSLNLGGEVKEKRVIPRHLFWGGLTVIIGYSVITLALLVVEGPNAATSGPFAVVGMIDKVFGKFMGNIASICIIAFFPIFTTVLNSAFARLLMVISIDRRLPKSLGKLNANRAPSNAILFQTFVAIIFTVIAFLLPYALRLGKPADIANEVFTVSLSTLTIVWAVSSIFLFIDLVVLYLRDTAWFHHNRIFPMPLLWVCIVVAPLASLVAIVVTLRYSPIPQIGDSQWWYVVGGLTLISLIFAAIGSIFATSEASWQDQTSG